jgi:hypothetical protein
MVISAINTAMLLMKNQYSNDKFYLELIKQAVVVCKTQYNLDIIENFSRSLLEFYHVFDKWHCGLNQLK